MTPRLAWTRIHSFKRRKDLVQAGARKMTCNFQPRRVHRGEIGKIEDLLIVGEGVCGKFVIVLVERPDEGRRGLVGIFNRGFRHGHGWGSLDGWGGVFAGSGKPTVQLTLPKNAIF